MLGVGDGPCGGLEDGHQETEGVPLEDRCGNALPWRMLPLTDFTKKDGNWLQITKKEAKRC